MRRPPVAPQTAAAAHAAAAHAAAAHAAAASARQPCPGAARLPSATAARGRRLRRRGGVPHRRGVERALGPPAVHAARAGGSAAGAPGEFLRPPRLPLCQAGLTVTTPSGRRVAFVGDSVMRYLYMTVMYWVETGDLSVPRVSDMLNDFLSKPPSELQREHMPPLVPHPGVAYSHEWGDGSWADYYWEGQRSFGGKMCCDCLRTDAGGRELPVRQQRENRYYSGGAGLDSAFFFMHGDHLVSGGKVGHTPGCFTGQLGGGRPCTKTGQPVPVHPRCDYAHGGAQIWLHDAMWIAEKPVWRGHPPAAIATQLMNYGVDALVVGVGLWQEWGAWSADPARAWTGMESLDRSLRPNGTALWLSWPAKCRGKDPGKEELVRRWVARRSPRWRVLDTALVTASLRRHLGCDPHRCPGWDQRSRSDPRLFPHCAVAWVDDVGHFQPWVYHEMAQLLYNALGCASTA
eukprot:TRINITY_DN11025_c0_g2_i3.p1 TRINITY_DN11025_c0_g2~~TRINITY_DN11025_c0_g2_i3.p1  ORF type:complete len:460 (+),score=94.01 TRINITY_DN11025_c0_g2_i3:110-1489(+)